MYTHYKKGDLIGGKFKVHDLFVGGMGEVYLCQNIESSLPYALKTFKKEFQMSRTMRESVFSEIELWVSLGSHPNIVQCYWMDNLDNKFFLGMEWVSGLYKPSETLQDYIYHIDTNFEEKLRFVLDICRGMIYSQTVLPGFVHRDLKPTNILVMFGEIARITDFGLAITNSAHHVEHGFHEELSNKVSVSKSGIGTPLYMSPEQWLGSNIDQRSDIYSIGCILAEALTKEYVFSIPQTLEENIVRNFLKQAHIGTPPNISAIKTINIDIYSIVKKCLEKDRSDRYKSIDELYFELQNLYQKNFGELPTFVEDKEFNSLNYGNRAAAFSQLGNYKKALEFYEEALKFEIEPERIYSNRALTFEKMGLFDDAIKNASQAIEINPDSDHSYFIRAIIYGNQKKYKEALTDHNESIRLSPNSAKNFINRATTFLQMGNLDAAINDLEIAIKLDIRDVHSYLTLADIYYQKNEYEKVKLLINKVLSMVPYEGKAYLILGNVFSDEKDFEKAIEYFDIAIDLDPNMSEAYSNKALALSDIGLADEAIIFFNKAFEINPSNAEFFYNRGSYFHKIGQLDNALDDLNNAISLNADFQQAYSNRANIYVDRKMYFEAMEDLNKCLELAPNNAIAYNNRGDLFHRMKRNDEALADFNKSIELDPNTPSVYYNRALLLQDMGKIAQATRDLNKTIELDPAHWRALMNRGLISVDKGKNEEAISFLNKAVSIEESPQTLLNRGECFLKMKDYDKAIADFSMAIKINASYKKGFMNRARAYERQGDKEKAMNDYSNAISLDNSDPEPYLGRGENQEDEQLALDDLNNAYILGSNNASLNFRIGLTLFTKALLETSLFYFEKAYSLGYLFAKTFTDEIKFLLVTLTLSGRKSNNSLPNILIDNDLVEKIKSIYKQSNADYLLENELETHIREIINNYKISAQPERICPIDLIYRDTLMSFAEKFTAQHGNAVDSSETQMVANYIHFYKNRKFDDALGIIEALLTNRPYDTTFHLMKCQTLVDMGNIKQALEECNKALAIDDESLILYYMRGKLYLDLSEDNKSLSDFDRVLKSDNADMFDEWLLNIGDMLAQKDYLHQALAFYTKGTLLGSKKCEIRAHQLFSELSFSAWSSSINTQMINDAMEKYPHLNQMLYIQKQEDDFIKNSSDGNLFFWQHRINLLKQTYQLNKEFLFFVAGPFLEKFGSALEISDLESVVAEHPKLVEPGYIQFFYRLFMDKIGDDMKPHLQKRFVDLFTIAMQNYDIYIGTRSTGK